MAKQFYSICFCLFAVFGLAQLTVLVKGQVVCTKLLGGQLFPVNHARVILSTSDGNWREIETDSSGNYTFLLKTAAASADVFIMTSKRTSCPGLGRDESILAQKGARTFRLRNGDTIKQDFRLTRQVFCRSLPDIKFAFLSVNMVYDSLSEHDTGKPEDAIHILYALLQDNPNMVIEISGHGDVREKPDLSVRRAQAVVDLLVKKGINTNRLLAKGYGCSKPLIVSSLIKTAKTKKEKEQLYQKNRRCEFKVVSFDFKE